MKLLLPLKFYDEGGRVLPPKGIWWCLLFVARSYVVFIFSLTLPEQSETLLKVFYPLQEQLYIGLEIGAIVLLPALLVSFREKVWYFHKEVLFKLIKPLIVIGLLVDFIFLSIQAQQNYWQFSWGIGVSGVINLIAMYWVLSSRHLQVMLDDWQLRVADK